jgi:phage-related protein
LYLRRCGLPDELKRVPARFYKNEMENEPVREWLQRLKKDDRRRIGADIATVEYGWPIGMPTCGAMGVGLWEVRTDLTDNRIARVLFCVADDHLVLLHGFIKKDRKTPKADLDLAKARKKQVTR